MKLNEIKKLKDLNYVLDIKVPDKITRKSSDGYKLLQWGDMYFVSRSAYGKIRGGDKYSSTLTNSMFVYEMLYDVAEENGLRIDEIAIIDTMGNHIYVSFMPDEESDITLVQFIPDPEGNVEVSFADDRGMIDTGDNIPYTVLGKMGSIVAYVVSRKPRTLFYFGGLSTDTDDIQEVNRRARVYYNMLTKAKVPYIYMKEENDDVDIYFSMSPHEAEELEPVDRSVLFKKRKKVATPNEIDKLLNVIKEKEPQAYEDIKFDLKNAKIPYEEYEKLLTKYTQ